MIYDAQEVSFNKVLENVMNNVNGTPADHVGVDLFI